MKPIILVEIEVIWNMKAYKICAICGRPLFSETECNNPQGAVWKTPDGEIEMPEFEADEVCCNDCNSMYVIPGRLYRMAKEKEGK